MLDIVWAFKTANFTLICEEEWGCYMGHRGQNDEYVGKNRRGPFILTRLLARVYFRNEEVGRAALSRFLPGDRYEVVRMAIGDARKTMFERPEMFSGRYVRKVA
jgi:hypothetical protein